MNNIKSFTAMFESKLQGLSAGMSLDDIAKKHAEKTGKDLKQIKDLLLKQMELGIEVEAEHTKDKKTARKIAMDHLFELPDYYTKLKKARL